MRSHVCNLISYVLALLHQVCVMFCTPDTISNFRIRFVAVNALVSKDAYELCTLDKFGESSWSALCFVLQLRMGFTGMTLSAAICFVGGYMAEYFGMVGAVIPIVTAITVCLATAFPKALDPLLPSCEGIANLLMHVCVDIAYHIACTIFLNEIMILVLDDFQLFSTNVLVTL